MSLKKSTASENMQPSKQRSNDNNSNDTRIRSSTKRPRAPIACFRCHHKKVRCDGIHPNCTRCLSTGILCAYPSSRRSRTTQPTNVDPFIDNLSQLEARIRRIETDLENQRSMVNSIVPHEENESVSLATSELKAKMLKTEIEVQDSRSILAQLRLKGEQRISRGKRAAAAAAAAAASASASANTSTNTTITTTANTREDKSTVHEPKLSSTETKHPRQPLYFQDMMLDNNTDFMSYESTGQTIDWTMFDNKPSLLNTMQPMSSDLYADHHMSFTDSKDMTSMVMNSILSPTSTRSSSLISNIGFPIVLQPSNSTHSTTSNMTTTSCSSLNSCENILQFNMEDMMFHNKDTLSNNTTMWFYPS